MFSPWEYNIDKAAERLLGDGRLERAGARPLSDRRRAGGAVSRAAGHAHAAEGPHPHQQPRHRVGRAGFDKMKTKGRAAAPFDIRYQNGKGPETLKADAVIDATGTWFSPNPAGADGLPAIGEARGPGPHRLRHARRAGPRPRALCRQDRRRAGRRPFGDRHADRSRAPEGRGAGHRNRSGCCAATSRKRRSAAAPTTSSPRAARWARPSPRWWRAARSGSRPASGSRTSSRDGERLRVGAGSACCGRHVTVDELVVATGFRPELDFLRELRLVARSRARMPARAGAADRSQRA